jgi:uncharacterized protein YndB with AHSA1/START domain
VDVVATLDAPVPPDVVFPWVEDLARYPDWLEIVPRTTTAAPAAGDPGPAWLVDLRGRVGPIARSKRLRMVRSRHEAPSHVRFDRRELDGRRHAAWVLLADVEAAAEGSRLTMRLHYGGGLWGPLVERLLADEIERSRNRLLALVTAQL